MQLIKIPCPTCGQTLNTKHTRGRARKRECPEGHVHYTFDNTLVEKRVYHMAEYHAKVKRQTLNLEDFQLKAIVPPTEEELEAEAEKTETRPKTKTGHYITETPTGTRYEMRW